MLVGVNVPSEVVLGKIAEGDEVSIQRLAVRLCGGERALFGVNHVAMLRGG